MLGAFTATTAAAREQAKKVEPVAIAEKAYENGLLQITEWGSKAVHRELKLYETGTKGGLKNKQVFVITSPAVPNRKWPNQYKLYADLRAEPELRKALGG